MTFILKHKIILIKNAFVLILSNKYIDYQHITPAESIVLMANYPYLQYNGEDECREASSLAREKESTWWARKPRLLDERAQEKR